MPTPRSTVFLAIAWIGWMAATATAQETGLPVFLSPDPTFPRFELGGSVSLPEGADLGLEGFASAATRRNDFGLRIGMVSWGSGANVLLGAHVRNRFIHHSAGFPFDMALTLGVGISTGDGDQRLAAPFGLSVGRRFRIQDSVASFVPYLHPVVVPVWIEGDLRWDLALGIGLDIQVSRFVDLRFSGGLGDIKGIAFSLAWGK